MIKTLSVKAILKRLKTPVSLLHSVKTWKTVSLKPQNGHLLKTAGLIMEIKESHSMAPCKILHWRSAVRFLMGGLYKTLHCGPGPLPAPSLVLHTVEALSFSTFLFVAFTMFMHGVTCSCCFSLSLCCTGTPGPPLAPPPPGVLMPFSWGL